MPYESMCRMHFEESIQLKKKALEMLCPALSQSIVLLIYSLKEGGKILACGNGGSAADCQHFAAELMNRFEIERAPLPAIALTTDSSNLTAIANDYSYAEVFRKQVFALGEKRDILVAISTSGNSISILNAILAALDKNMKVIALTGKNGGEIGKIKHSNFFEIRVPHERTARIQELHMLIIHAWCNGIDIAFSE